MKTLPYDIDHRPRTGDGIPRLELSYDEKPSWKVYGDGRKLIRFDRYKDGTIELKTMEFCRTTNRARETFTTIPASLIPAVIAFLQTGDATAELAK